MLTKKEIKLQELIEANAKPVLENCTWSYEDVFTLGMLRDLGWAEKHYICGYDGDVEDIEWTYTGPNSFILKTCGGKDKEITSGMVF